MVFEYATIVFACVFLAILFLLHFLKRELDPSWRMISEYEIGRFGWMMRLAFFCWGASVLALLIAIWPSLRSLSGVISRGWLVVIVTALFGAGIFKTNPITENTPNLVNTIHTICGAIVILTFPIAASLVVNSLLKNYLWLAGEGQLIFVTVLAWIGMVAYFSSIIISGIKNPATVKSPSAEKFGPHVQQGWPNRIMVVIYMIWLITVAGYGLSFVNIMIR
jgi:hypothetical protein